MERPSNCLVHRQGPVGACQRCRLAKEQRSSQDSHLVTNVWVFLKELIGINKFRWYSHQPQRFLVEACCEAKRWKHLRLVSVSKIAATVEPDPALHQSLPDLLWNLLRNPVEPDLALHQSLPEPFPEPSPEPCWTWPGSAPKPKPPRNFSGTFFGALLNLTSLSTKAFQTFPVEPDLALHQSLLDLLRNLLRNPVEPDLALHQSLPEASPEPSSKPCWTWPGSAPKPKPPRNFSGTFFGALLNLTSFSTKASQTFSGTFSGTLLNLTWLCTKAS